MVVNASGRAMTCKLMQLSKAFLPIVLTVLGMLIAVRAVHFQKEAVPIALAEEGSVMDVMAEQP